MSTSSRRVGATNSKTRDRLLDCVEDLMLNSGYASVSYRSVAARSGMTASLVQYYFPSRDDIFLAAIRRYSRRNVSLLSAALRSHSGNLLRILWNFSWDEATGPLMVEFMALGNHRERVRSAIAEATERIRTLQLEALENQLGDDERFRDDVSLGAALILFTGFPKFLTLETGLGVRNAHREITRAFEHYLTSIETPNHHARSAVNDSNRSTSSFDALQSLLRPPPFSTPTKG